MLENFDINWWRDHKIGICLSSGYFGFFAHTGFLSAMEQLNIKISYLTGSSAGALVGCMYASRIGLDDIKNRLINLKLFDIINTNPLSNSYVVNKFLFNILKYNTNSESSRKTSYENIIKLIDNFNGVISKEKFKQLLKEILPVSSFEETKIKLILNAFSLIDRKTKYLDSGDIVSAVLASSAHPMLFTPVERDGDLFIDGGTFEKCPIFPLINHEVEGIIIHYLPSAPEGIGKIRLNYLIEGLYNKYRLEIARNNVEEARRLGIKVKIIAPRDKNSGLLKLKKGADIIQQTKKDVIARINDNRFGCKELW